ncbi:hypothetical protein PSTG_15257 [Puccinia striiformis f. sp. tritici PST-78]|uniref:Uncharacterized protein n=1 Tax=Puccinia striiformis f. sp. tritici PST-78 TaxID=1165861 RepID=A0A0L0UW93_9BASI|nr:hypothetical protein PSTG_15257 [Puccinia striiformis f. sp. tritici PST-78]
MHCQRTWLGWPHPSQYWVRPHDSNSGLGRQVNLKPIQARWQKAWASKFKLAGNILGGQGPILNCAAAPNIGSGAAIRARFTGGDNNSALSFNAGKLCYKNPPGYPHICNFLLLEE